MSDQDPKSWTLETPKGTVNATTTTLPSAPDQKVTLVGGDELRRLTSLNDQARKFLFEYAGRNAPETLEAYDNAFRNWQASKSSAYSEQDVIELLGGVLGNTCVSELDMQWVIVEDEYGTDYAVRHKRLEVLAFPFSTVLKRIEKRENGFLDPVFEITKHTIDSGDAREWQSVAPSH
jgi:hypothetical protein